MSEISEIGTTKYWKLVDEYERVPDGYHRRQTFEHALPNGGMLILVRYADRQSESCTMTYVPPMPVGSEYR